MNTNQFDTLKTKNETSFCETENNTIDVSFETIRDIDSNEGDIKQPDMTKYTVIDADHLDEDTPIKGQEFCLFSFMSPEGVMNCNVRAVKFRGAYSTMADAEKKAGELEKTDKYFKIFIGDSGKWLDFDPPSSRVDREMCSNKEHQKILDVQRKQRMDKINTLASKHKDLLDKKDKGKSERIAESKKSGAASDAVDKQKTQKQNKMEEKQEKQENVQTNSKVAAHDTAKSRLKKRLEESQNKKACENAQESTKLPSINTLNQKIKVVGKISEDLENKKTILAEADKNIENIKKLMASRKTTKINT